MGWFSSKPEVPNTITDQQRDDLRRRAEKAAPPMFSRQAIERRHAESARLRNAEKN